MLGMGYTATVRQLSVAGLFLQISTRPALTGLRKKANKGLLSTNVHLVKNVGSYCTLTSCQSSDNKDCTSRCMVRHTRVILVKCHNMSMNIIFGCCWKHFHFMVVVFCPFSSFSYSPFLRKMQTTFIFFNMTVKLCKPVVL